MTVFNSAKDAAYQKARVAEYHKLIRPARKLYHKVTMTKVAGTKGVTSASAVRRFSDVDAPFAAVLAGSILRIRDPEDPSDNGDYKIAVKVSSSILEVTSNWPYGECTGLAYEVVYHDSRGNPAGTDVYVETAAIPFVIIINPSPKVLTRYGYDRPRDAILVFAAKTLSDYGVTPEVGDRFIDDTGRECEITDLRDEDWFSGSGTPLTVIGSAGVVTTKKIG